LADFEPTENVVEKLIVEFQDCGDSTGNMAICVVYESADAFLKDLRNEVEKKLPEIRQFDENLRDLAASRDKLRPSAISEERRQILERWWDSREAYQDPEVDFYIGDAHLYYENFTDADNMSYVAPKVYTLDQWFEKNIDTEVIWKNGLR
jgi:hypothetical protein